MKAKPEYQRHSQSSYGLEETLEQKIEAGYRSLRAGRYIDGDAFMEHLEAELCEIDRQVANT